MELFWFTQAIAYGALVLFLVPPRYIKEFLPFAFLGGFIYTIVVQYVAINVLQLWHYKPDIFSLWGMPVFFVLSWFAVTLIYGFLLYKYPQDQLWILAFFVLWATGISFISGNLAILFMPNWSVAETFMFAIFSHVLLLYIFKLMHNVNELGAKEDILGFSLSILKNKRD